MPLTREETVDFVDLAPSRVTTERVLDASPDRVFDVLADTAAWSTWYSYVKVRWTSTDMACLGATRQVRLGRVRVDERFIAWDPGKRWGFTVTGSNVPFARAIVEMAQLDPVGKDRTRLLYTIAFELTPGLAAFEKLIVLYFRRVLRKFVSALQVRLSELESDRD